MQGVPERGGETDGHAQAATVLLKEKGTKSINVWQEKANQRQLIPGRLFRVGT